MIQLNDADSFLASVDSGGLNRESFLLHILYHVVDTLEDTVGKAGSAGFIAMVGQIIGDDLNTTYQNNLGHELHNPEALAAALTNLKQHIQATFSVEYIDDHKIVLHNTQCPFGANVVGRDSFCMMTTNVLGIMTAENLGYAKVVLDKTIAASDGHCKVTIYYRESSAVGIQGEEFFPS